LTTLIFLVFCANLLNAQDFETSLREAAKDLVNPVYAIIEIPQTDGTIEYIEVLKSELEKINQLETDYEFVRNEWIEIEDSFTYMETLDRHIFPETRFFKVILSNDIVHQTKKVMVKAPSNRIEVVPATYETVTEKVMAFVCCPSLKLKTFPAEYKITTKRILVKPASKRLIGYCELYPNDCYETVTEMIEISAATTKWVKRKSELTRCCFSSSPEDCQIWCLVEVPARYELITKNVLKAPYPAWEIEIPAEYKTVRDTILVKPERKEYVKDCPPPKYVEMTKRVVKIPATTKTIEKPAEYLTKDTSFIREKSSIIEFELPVKYWHFPNYSKIRVIEIPPVYEIEKKKILIRPVMNGELQIYDTIQEVVLKKAVETRLTADFMKAGVCDIYMNRKPRIGDVIDEFVTIDIKTNDIIRHYRPRKTEQIINEIVLDNIQIFPNPTTDILNIQSEENIESVQVLNTKGQIILSRNYENQNNIQLNISDLASSLYSVQIKTSKGFQISKIIKQ
jgi:hypothetical protein